MDPDWFDSDTCGIDHGGKDCLSWPVQQARVPAFLFFSVVTKKRLLGYVGWGFLLSRKAA